MQLLLALRMDLANARFVARDYAAALSDFDEVLPTLAEVLGARHPAVLDCRYNQALSNAALSQNEVALRQMTSLLADVQAARGESDLLALLLRREIAALLIKLGERAAGRRVPARVAPRDGRDPGPGPPGDPAGSNSAGEPGSARQRLT
ncbi:hypothetical protein OG320_03715 [Microbispora sp. NBC_01189]|uniref:hypothetical protein n=1 Tax=Microbispora sp. NBC_01189 TaxID=2903583 RepID=UPI002E1127C9|nr:hypothetical protein OG320_03715 [Microbispora sp. NBC_01189]